MAAANTTPTTTVASAAPEDKFKKFEDDGVTFKAKLIGSELVMEPRGDKMCQNSIQRLKAIIKGQKVHKKRIVMKISYSGVKVCDEKTNEILYHHEVPQISFIASDDTDSRTFGYVCDVPNKAHQFICFKTSGPALQVMSEISSLFEAVLEKKKQLKQDGTGGVGNKDKDSIAGESENNSSTSPTITKSTSMLNAVAFRDGDDDNEEDVATNNNNNNNNSSNSNKNDYYKNELVNNLETTTNDLRDLQITSGIKRLDESPFDLFASDGGGSTGAGGDSGIMDLTFNDWLPSPQRQPKQHVAHNVTSSHQRQLPPPPPPQFQPQQTSPIGGGSAAIPIAKTHRPQTINFTSSSFSGSRFGGHLLSSTTPTPAMINSASPTLADNNRFPNSAQNRSLIYNHSSVSLNDAALSHRAPASPMSPLGGFPRQESTDKYAVFNDIDALPSIFESISSLDSASKLSNAGQQVHPGSQSMDHRQHQTNRRQQFTQPTIASSVGATSSLSNQQFHQSPPPSSSMVRQMNPFDDDFFA